VVAEKIVALKVIFVIVFLKGEVMLVWLDLHTRLFGHLTDATLGKALTFLNAAARN
jgi:hypothetical protein